MKEVKQFSKGYIFVSALYVVLGGVLAAWPTSSLQMICYGLGFALIVMGITHGIIYFTRENLQGMLQMDLVIGIVCLAAGVFVLLNPTFIKAVLPFAMGIIFLLGAVLKIQSSINMKRLKFQKWYLVLLSGLVIIALGIVLLCNVIKEERYMILYVGLCLIFDGLTNLISLISIQLRVKKLSKLQRQHPGVSYDDLLDQRHRKAIIDPMEAPRHPAPGRRTPEAPMPPMAPPPADVVPCPPEATGKEEQE